MAITKEKGLGLDSKKLVSRAIAISPNRDQYFMDIITQIKKKYPKLRILYANNTMGARIDPDRPNPDFVLIMQGKLTSRNPLLKPRDVIIMDAPMIFTERSIAGWTMAVEQGNLEGYFAYMFDKALRIDVKRFYEFVEHYCSLSLDPTHPRYWKKIENTNALIKDLEELHARYTKKQENAVLNNKRGYTDVKPLTSTPQPPPIRTNDPQAPTATSAEPKMPPPTRKVRTTHANRAM